MFTLYTWKYVDIYYYVSMNIQMRALNTVRRAPSQNARHEKRGGDLRLRRS
jgi:hypothetical protein